MAYHHRSDDLDLVAQPYAQSYVMEPEAVIPTSEGDTSGSPSTPGSKSIPPMGGSSSLKKANSSPNVLGLTIDSASMSAADKKRNKLGYHRSAVACGKDTDWRRDSRWTDAL
jgi:hypothetical protein